MKTSAAPMSLYQYRVPTARRLFAAVVNDGILMRNLIPYFCLLWGCLWATAFAAHYFDSLFVHFYSLLFAVISIDAAANCYAMVLRVRARLFLENT